MSQNKNFFSTYVLNNGFKYKNDSTALDNMKNLLNHMNIEEFSSGYYTFFKRYHSFNLKGISNCSNKEEILNFFRDQYYFNDSLQFNNKGFNYLDLFRKLSDFMGFNYVYASEKPYFKSLNLENKRTYIEDYVSYMGLSVKISPKLSLEQQFEKISDLCDWNFYKYFKKKLDEVILEEAEETLKDVGGLKKIAIRYNLYKKQEDIPNNMKKLEKEIKKNLFVNIYDYINKENNKKFSDILKLSHYTIERKLIFPLKEAKEKLTYKVLLKKLVLGNFYKKKEKL